MNYFPVSSSILSARHLAVFLQKQYNFGEKTDCQLIKAGINHSYLVSDQGKKFVFRVYTLNWRTRTEILEEIKLLNELKKHGIQVSFPIFDKNTNYIQELDAPEGERFGLLFSFAEGEKKIHDLPLTLHTRIGEMMAKMHKITQNMVLERTTYERQNLLVDSLAHLQKFSPEESEEMNFMKTAQAYLLAEMEKIEWAEVRRGVVHLDMWVDNMNIKNDQDITLFDFDFCGNGWLVLDLAYYILQIYYSERNDAECRLRTDYFLAGYESVCALSAEEKRILPFFVLSLYFYYLGVQSQRFENWSNVFFNENYLKRYITVFVKRFFESHQMA